MSRFIFYLVTKKSIGDKPTMATLSSSLFMMFARMKKMGLTTISMPRIGCGLDRLDWEEVEPLIERCSSRYGIQVTVYHQEEEMDATEEPEAQDGPSYIEGDEMPTIEAPIVEETETTRTFGLL